MPIRIRMRVCRLNLPLRVVLNWKCGHYLWICAGWINVYIDLDGTLRAVVWVRWFCGVDFDDGGE